MTQKAKIIENNWHSNDCYHFIPKK